LQIKKLRRPTKRSGRKLNPGQTSSWLSYYGVEIHNHGKEAVWVDSVTPKKRKKARK
jgi:hypothetical protein